MGITTNMVFPPIQKMYALQKFLSKKLELQDFIFILLEEHNMRFILLTDFQVYDTVLLIIGTVLYRTFFSCLSGTLS